LILDDFDDHGLIEEPVPKHASVFVDKWVSYINKMLENTDGAIKNGQLSYLRYWCLLGSSLPPVVCRTSHVLFTLLVFAWFVFTSSCL
jgi:hypothetical protein